MAAASASICTREIARKLARPTSGCSAVAAWRDAPYFTEAERAALALTEALTRLSDRADPGAGCDLERGRQAFRRAGARNADSGDRQHQRLEPAQRRRTPARGRMEDLMRFFLFPCGRRCLRFEKADGGSLSAETDPSPVSPSLRADASPSPTRGGKRIRPRMMAFSAFLPNFTSRDGRQVSTPPGVLI